MKAIVHVPNDARLFELFAPEEKTFPRGSYEMKSVDNEIIFEVQAQDASALRALLSAITKILSLWEDAKSL